MLKKIGIATDTVFKYLVTLGVVIIVVCGSYKLLSNTALMESKNEWHIKYTELEIEGASQSALDIYTQNAKKYFDEREKLRKKLLKFSDWGIGASIIFLIMGLAIWVGRQSNENMLLRLQVEQAQLEKEILEKKKNTMV